jgi:hypothetical protein
MTEQEQKQVLVEVVNTFGRQEWFRDAVVWNSYPTNGTPTLEFKVNYVPVFERKSVMDFAMRVNLMEKFTVVDAKGNPSE